MTACLLGIDVSTTTTNLNSAPDETQIDALLEAMTLEEQVSLLAGAGFWTTVPVARLGIPAIKVSDGPNGARGGGSLVGGVKAAAFPVGIALASTWNTDLVGQVGAALAEEAQSKGAHVPAGADGQHPPLAAQRPQLRVLLGGPYLSAGMAVAYIQGVQSKGVAATVKHFVGNESEFERMTISSEIDERTLREIYLPPFEAAVKRGGTLGGDDVLQPAQRHLHQRAQGPADRPAQAASGASTASVMSDWFGSHSTWRAPPTAWTWRCRARPGTAASSCWTAVQAGRVSAAAVEEARAPHAAPDRSAPARSTTPRIADEQAIDRPEHRALIRGPARKASCC